MLRLESEARASRVGAAARADQAAVEEVAAVELEPGLRGLDLERSARSAFLHPGDRDEGSLVLAIDDEVVVVASGGADLVELVVDPERRGQLQM